MLKKSRAAYFGDHIFPLLDEKRFAALYSESSASGPNTPVNIIIGALHRKSMFNLTDEEILERPALLKTMKDAIRLCLICVDQEELCAVAKYERLSRLVSE